MTSLTGTGRACVSVALLLALAVPSAITLGDPPDQGRDRPDLSTLKGLNGIWVVIEEPGTEAADEGLTKEALRTTVELQLRKAGVPLLTQEQVRMQPGSPFLYVHAHVFRPKDGILNAILVYSIRVGLHQRCTIDRDERISTLAMTWEAPQDLGTVGARNARMIKELVAERVDVFANAYLAANPR